MNASGELKPGSTGQRVDRSFVVGDLIQVQGVGGNVTITTDRPPYRVEALERAARSVSPPQARSQPSRLLLARYQVVPFTGRAADLNDMAEWMAGAESVSVRLIHAAGGQGKTRLAGHAATVWAAAGWAVWRVVHAPTPLGVSRVDMPHGGGVLAIVDYADRWPASHLLALLTHLRNLSLRGGVTVRVLLLARSARAWWPRVSDELDSEYAMTTSTRALAPLGRQVDRVELFRTARRRFAEAMEVTGTEDLAVPPGLDDDAFAQVLAVHMAALVGVDAHRRGAVPPVRPHALSTYLLRRESAHWHALHARVEDRRQTSPEVMERVVYIATLTGAVPRAEARLALQRVDLTEPGVDTIIDDHRFCYPSEDSTALTVLQPLHPDRLGEDLLALSTPGHPHVDDDDSWQPDDWAATAANNLLTSATTVADPPTWTAAAVTVLVETAHRWPHIGNRVLYPLLRSHPHLALLAGGATLTRLSDLPDVDLSALEAVEQVLPDRRHVNLDIAAAAITARLTEHRLAQATDDADRVQLHTTLGYRLANAGLREPALAATAQAVAACRRLATIDRDVVEPALADILGSLGDRLSEVGRRDEALAATVEAVDIYRRLAATAPLVFEFDDEFAAALTSLGSRLLELGRREEALAATVEAVNIYRVVAATNAEALDDELATALIGLGQMLSSLGRRDEALAAATEAGGMYRRLAATEPAVFEPSLAAALHNLGSMLSGLERREEALAATVEAVEIYRRLANANPAAFETELAGALSSLGSRRSAMGRREEALGATAEAVDILRRLADANPAAVEPDLAMALTNFSVDLHNLGHRKKALPLTLEAVDIYRRLAVAHPATFEPDLGVALNNLGFDLSELGQREEALAVTVESVDVYRRLAETYRDAFEPDLALALTNLCGRLARLGLREEALAAAVENVAVCRRLVASNPAAFEPGLAMALHALGVSLSKVGRQDEALTAAVEAVGLRRRQVATDQSAFEDELALALTSLGERLSDLGRKDEAIAASSEAVDIYRQLAATNPAFAYYWAMAQTNLGRHLSDVGRQQEAQTTTANALRICRRLVKDEPEAFRDDLAEALDSFALVRAAARVQLRQAAAAAHESVALYETLARQQPRAFVDALRHALTTLAAVLDAQGKRSKADDVRRRIAAV